MSSGVSEAVTPASDTDEAKGQRPVQRLWTRLSKALGLHPHATEALAGKSTATDLAEERTHLALERSYLASERTLMAWIRTALSMISFGFTLGKIGQVMQHEITGLFGKNTFSITNIAYGLVIIGTVALLGAILQHIVRVHALYRLGFPRQFSIAQGVALLLVLVGGFALTSLVLEL